MRFGAASSGARCSDSPARRRKLASGTAARRWIPAATRQPGVQHASVHLGPRCIPQRDFDPPRSLQSRRCRRLQKSGSGGGQQGGVPPPSPAGDPLACGPAAPWGPPTGLIGAVGPSPTEECTPADAGGGYRLQHPGPGGRSRGAFGSPARGCPPPLPDFWPFAPAAAQTPSKPSWLHGAPEPPRSRSASSGLSSGTSR